MSQISKMRCKICGDEYPVADPIRRTCGKHSTKVSDQKKFLMTIAKNFQNPFYQNHSHGIHNDDNEERFYSLIWWGF